MIYCICLRYGENVSLREWRCGQAKAPTSPFFFAGRATGGIGICIYRGSMWNVFPHGFSLRLPQASSFPLSLYVLHTHAINYILCILTSRGYPIFYKPPFADRRHDLRRIDSAEPFDNLTEKRMPPLERMGRFTDRGADYHFDHFPQPSQRQTFPDSVREAWVRHYADSDSSAESCALAVDAAGNVYVTGYSKTSGTENDYATLKYNSKGTELWVARYDGSYVGPGNNPRDVATDPAVDASRNVYVTGYSEGSNWPEYWSKWSVYSTIITQCIK